MSHAHVRATARARSLATTGLLTGLIASTAVVAVSVPSAAGPAESSQGAGRQSKTSATIPAEHIAECSEAGHITRLDETNIKLVDSRVVPVDGAFGPVEVTEASYQLPDGRFCDIATATTETRTRQRYLVDGTFTRASIVTADGADLGLGAADHEPVSGVLDKQDDLPLGAVAYKPLAVGMIGADTGLDPSLHGTIYTQETTAGFEISLTPQEARDVTLPPTAEQREAAAAKRDARIEASEAKLASTLTASKSTRRTAAKRARTARATAKTGTRNAATRLQLKQPERTKFIAARDAAAAVRLKTKLVRTWKKHQKRADAALDAHRKELAAARAEYRAAGTVVTEWVTVPGRTTSRTAQFSHAAAAYAANHQVGGVVTSAALSVPLAVSSGVVDVAAGYEHTLALKEDGTVIAWGDNSDGQTSVPAGLGPVVDVAADRSRSYAVLADGTVRAWGQPDPNLDVPAGMVDVVKVIPTGQAVLALKSDGTVVGWGASWGRIKNVPAGLSDVVEVVASDSVAIALKSDGTAVGWGNGGETWSSGGSGPLSDVVHIAGNIHEVYAVTADGAVHYWSGNHAFVDPLPADVADRALDIDVSFEDGVLFKDGTIRRWEGMYDHIRIPNAWLADVTFVSESGSHAAALMADGSVTVTGFAVLDPETAPADIADAVQVRGGQYHGLARYADGSVKVWGSDEYGQLQMPTGLTDVVDVDGGREHSVALRADGTVVAWGTDYCGESTPPAGLTDVVDVEAGAWFSLARQSDGTVVAWGCNDDGETDVPAGLDDVVQMSATGAFTVVRHSDGTVSAWGRNHWSQLDVPAGLNDVVDIATTPYSVEAVKADGTIVAWGGTDPEEDAIRATVTDAVDVEAGNGWTVALTSNGTVVTWGANGYGQRVLPDRLPAIATIAGGYDNWWFTPRGEA